jgi:hypothetical protein
MESPDAVKLRPFYLLVLLLVLAATLLPGATARAQKQGRQFAVIVALDYNWAGPDVRLHFTLSDADRFRRFLGAPAEQTAVLTDAPTAPAGKRATRANILAALRAMTAKVGSQDTFWFYYSGHGKFLKGDDTSYLIPADVQRLDATTGVSVREVRSLLNDKATNRARSSILVLDACESGSSRKWVTAGETEPVLSALEGVATFAAARPDRSAYETEKAPVRGGLFTYYLCAGLAGAMTSPQKPDVTLGDLQKYVTDEVNEACERIGKTPQEPVFLASGSDWQSVVVGTHRADVLAGLDMAGANSLNAASVTERPPLEPGMIVALADGSVGVDDGALAYLKEGLVDAGVPLLSTETVAPFLTLLTDPKQTPAALAEAERYNARLLLRVRVKSNLRESPSTPGVTTGSVSMEAELLDVHGRVSATLTDTVRARPSGQAENVLDDALRKVSAKILTKLKGKLPLKTTAP